MKILWIIENGLFATVCLLSALCFMLIIKCVRTGRRIMRNARKRQAAMEEWVKDVYRLDIWKGRHPFGPVNGKEWAEYKQLVTDQIGSYERCCESHNWLVDFNHIEELRELIKKDWD
jgi:hypothetical protein